MEPILTVDGDKSRFFNLEEALCRIDAQRRDIGGYQYGNIYLTNMISRAINYARRSFAFGEIGLNVYRMLDAAEMIKFPVRDPDPQAEEALTGIKNFARSEARPVILEIDDYDIDDLRAEDGSPPEPFQLPDHEMSAGVSFRYLGELPLPKYKRMTPAEAAEVLKTSGRPF